MKNIIILLFCFTSCTKAQIAKVGKRAVLQSNTLSTFDFNNFIDSSGNGNHLVIGGSAPPVIVPNVFIGNAGTYFGGKTIALAEPEKYPLTSNYTFELRFKRDANNLGTRQVVFGLWRLVYRLYFDTDNKLYYQHGASIINTTAAITDSNTHTFAVVKNGTALTMYIDGVSAATATVGASFSPEPQTYFQFGDDDDYNLTAGWLFATIGDFRFSNNARYTSNYTPSNTYLVSDANTVSIISFNKLSGNWLSEPAYQGNILTRSGYTQASGGWANPDGFLQSPDGSYFFSVSGFNGTRWTVYAAHSNTSLGSYTLYPTAIQTPTVGEGTLAGNGTVIYYGSKYRHLYHDDSLDMKISSGDSLNQVFTAGTTIFVHGIGGYTAYADPFVRIDSGKLLMYFIGNNISLNRFILTSTSTDGYTWTTPVDHGTAAQLRYGAYTGEAAQVHWGNKYIITGDGASASSGVGRNVVRWISKDGVRFLPLGKLISPAGGSYIAVYDSSPYYDAPNKRLVYICTNSTNTQPTQPTDSDLGIWYVNINGAY